MLPLAGFGEEIRVRGEKHPPESGGSVQELRVTEPTGAVLERGEEIDAAQAQGVGHGAVDVVVEVEADGQGSDLPGGPQPGDERMLNSLSAEALDQFLAPPQIGVDLVLVVPVVGEGGVDLTQA